MKTRNILKALAFAMLVPALLLTTACGSIDDTINNNEDTARKGFALPVTLNVTRQDDATRAEYNESTRKLAFSAGDKLVVTCSYSGSEFGGVLDWVSDGTFSGTIYTKNEFSGTAQELFNSVFSTTVVGTLVPAGYDTYGYMTISNSGTYECEAAFDNTKTFASTKKLAVEQFCYEWAFYDKSSSSFPRTPHNAILNFTVTDLVADTEYNVTVDGGYTIAGTVTTDASGNATFAAGVGGGLYFKNLGLTVGDKIITLNFPADDERQFAGGNIYNINRSIYAVGHVICTDGSTYATVSAAATAGKTPVAMIAYVGSASDCTHGLAIALEDVSSKYLKWIAYGDNNEGKTASQWCDGWNTSKPVTDGTWRLPSIKDWQYILLGCGASGSYSENPTSLSCSELAAKLSAAGGTALVTGYWEGNYWSSNEVDYNYKWSVNFDGSASFTDHSFNENDFRARACLAF